MMNDAAKIDDGGPAFPIQRYIPKEGGGFIDLGEYVAIPDGISLRDYLAARAMPSLIEGIEFEMRENSMSKQDRTGFDDHRKETGTTYAEEVAIDAYCIADAMLRVRKEPPLTPNA